MIKGCFFLFLSCISLWVTADTDPVYLRAEKFYKGRQYDSAIVYFNQVVNNYPEKGQAYYNRGLCFYNLGRYGRAVADFEACLQIDSSFIDAQFMKAIALQKQGNLTQAIHELEQVKARNKDYDEVDKRIKNYRFAVYLSETWYYMIAIILLFIVLIALVARTVSYRKW